jgi:transcription initiation factor TFIID subunit 9B
VYANHSKKKGIDLEDVKLASTMLLDKQFTGPPPREVLFEVAKQKNSQPLPQIKPHSGLRLPPDRHCLLAANYKLRAASAQAPTKKLVKTALENSTIKTKLVTSGGSTTTAIKKPGLGQTLNKTSNVSIPKPTFKVAKPVINKPLPSVSTTAIAVDSDLSGIKRKRSNSDEFDALS